MLNIITKEVPIDEELKTRIEFMCNFCNIKPTIINGSVRRVEKTNLVYTKWHTIIKSMIYFILKELLKIII